MLGFRRFLILVVFCLVVWCYDLVIFVLDFGFLGVLLILGFDDFEVFVVIVRRNFAVWVFGFGFGVTLGFAGLLI